MCCLRYEYDAYKDFKSRAPKKNAQVETPDGTAKVVDLDVPREVVSLRIEGEKPVRVPLSDFDAPEEGARPKCVGCEAWERALSEQPGDAFGAAAALATPQLSGKDKLADRSSVRHVPGGKKADGAAEAKPGRSSRRGRGKGEHAEQQKAAAAQPARKPRRRRSTKVSGGAAQAGDNQAPRTDSVQTANAVPAGKQSNQGGKQPKEGQAKRRGMQPSKRRGQGGKDAKQQPGQGGKHPGSSQQAGKRGQGSKGGSDAQRGGKPDNQGPKARVRPGQKSSGLAQGPRPDQGGQRKQREGGQEGQAPGQHRRARRRSHKAAGAGEGQGSAQGN